jgi:hypothetical protein
MDLVHERVSNDLRPFNFPFTDSPAALTNQRSIPLSVTLRVGSVIVPPDKKHHQEEDGGGNRREEREWRRRHCRRFRRNRVDVKDDPAEAQKRQDGPRTDLQIGPLTRRSE